MNTGCWRIKPCEIERALGYLAYVLASTGETQHMPSNGSPVDPFQGTKTTVRRLR